MGFVGNYAPHGLSPQMYDMPVIPKREAFQQRKASLVVSKYPMGSLYTSKAVV